MSKRSRILLLIPHLGGGGAERVAAILAAGLDAGKYEVHLGVVTGRGPIHDSLFPGVTVHDIGARRVRASLPGIWRLVRRVRPHAILSGMAHLNLLVLMLRGVFPRGTRVLVRQNSAPGERDAGRWTPILYRALYRGADAVICQTRSMAEDVAAAAGTTTNLRVLANPVDVEAVRRRTRGAESRWLGPGPHLLAVGRLAPEKGFDLLLKAVASVREQFPLVNLTILGNGREETPLRALTEELRLGDAVHFAGYAPDPEAWFAGASLFVLSSRREGLPNALLEAAAAGMPIAATPAKGGLRNLLAEKEGVWMAREITAMALGESITEALTALETGKRFAHVWIDEFRLERAIAGYEALIDAVLVGRQ